MLLTRVSLLRRKPVYAFMILAFVAGIVSYFDLPRESYPDITIPNVMVVTPYGEGVSASDIETLITIPLEKKLRGVKDVKEMTSSSSEGSSIVTLEFNPDIEIETALQRVREKVDEAKQELPDDLENDPKVLEINLSEFPIIMVSLFGDVNERTLKATAERLEEEIEGISGVLDVVVSGVREREIRVEFDHEKLAQLKLSHGDLGRIIRNENVNVPGGSIDVSTGKYLVRVPSEFDDPNEINNLIITTVDGKPIYLSEVATVKDTLDDETTISRINGKKSATLSVKKRTGENIIEVAQQVFLLLEKSKDQIPSSIDYAVTLDQAKEIRERVTELENSIITSFILVFAVLLFFLGGRNAMFVAIAIPFSMLISMIVLNALGITLNMVVLFALILALGMLVDNAIVIVENIYRHMTEENKPAHIAAYDGTKEVGWPVIASTMTTLCAFFPLMFWPGIIGEFMLYLPLTLTVTLASSLAVALVFNPVACAAFMREDKTQRDVFARVSDKYSKFLSFTLDKPKTTIASCFAFLFLMISGFVMTGNGAIMFPEIDPNMAIVEVELKEGTNLSSTDDYTAKVESITLKETDLDNVVAVTGDGGGDMFSAGSSASHKARITLDFKDRALREESSTIVSSRIREALPADAGVSYQLIKEQKGPPTGNPVNIEVSGERLSDIMDATNAIKSKISGIAGLVNLQDNMSQAKPEFTIKVDRQKAAMLGVTSAEVSAVIKAAIAGYKLGTYRDGTDEYDIVARLPEQKRTNFETLKNLTITAQNGNIIPLSEIASFSLASGFGSIKHIDSDRVITISADVDGRTANEVLSDVIDALQPYEAPKGVSVSFTGETEEQSKASAFLLKAFTIAAFLIVIILLMQFNSFSQSLIIMISVILSLGGVFLGLVVTNTPFSIIMTGIGVISLAGVAVNNAIVLIDYTNQLRNEGMELREAVIRAGEVRLRPVLLTAITTILGLLPMAIGLSIDFFSLSLEWGTESTEWWGPMAVAVIFGLAIATILTLIVVPTIYHATERFFEKRV